MIKKIAWNTFKNTGDINAFLELKQIENIEDNLKKSELKDIEDIKKELDKYGKYENKWNNII